jgi:hypothetical protein
MEQHKVMLGAREVPIIFYPDTLRPMNLYDVHRFFIKDGKVTRAGTVFFEGQSSHAIFTVEVGNDAFDVAVEGGAFYADLNYEQALALGFGWATARAWALNVLEAMVAREPTLLLGVAGANFTRDTTCHPLTGQTIKSLRLNLGAEAAANAIKLALDLQFKQARKAGEVKSQ